MSPILLLAGLGAAAFAAMVAKGKKLPDGENPFDAFPPGVDSRPIGSELVTASSMRRYKVTSFRSADGRGYFVAETKGDVDWLSYFLTPSTGARALWAANADNPEDIDAMQRDFQLQDHS
jgi:hypothetical protein